MNKQFIQARSSIIKRIRRFFDERGYLEMHTPRLVGLPGQEPHLEPFWTDVTEPGAPRPVPCALITSPEYAMKRLLSAGFDRIYDLGPCFRNNEPWDGTHDPEFLMLEWYRKDADLDALMTETEEMVRFVASQETNSQKLQTEPFRRLTCEQAWKEYAGVDLTTLLNDRDAIAKAAQAHGQTVSETDSWDDLYFKIFLSKIEPKLGEVPTFLHRYPASQAALAKACHDDARFADRVELYLGGLELANGFAELADATEQRKRFEEERTLRQSLGKKT